MATKIGLEFVSYIKIQTTLEAIDAEMLRPSVQAVRNGCGEDKKREGVVLRPLVEMTDSRGDRVIAKHKNPEFGRSTGHFEDQFKAMLEEAEKTGLIRKNREFN